MKTIMAQVLYDLREKTAQISGTDLHDLFRSVLDGDPSPVGRTPISVDALIDLTQTTSDPDVAQFVRDVIGNELIVGYLQERERIDVGSLADYWPTGRQTSWQESDDIRRQRANTAYRAAMFSAQFALKEKYARLAREAGLVFPQSI